MQRALAEAGLRQPPLAQLLPMLRAAGYGAAQSHTERKSLKTSATLREVVRCVAEAGAAEAAVAQAEQPFGDGSAGAAAQPQ